ncbi:10076_t:CDS:1, partial [Ambispora gerdemannii]
MDHNANPQYSGSPKVRASYTAQENADLREYLMQKRREGSPLRGNLIYLNYPGLNGRHPWQSIRDHAIKFIMPKLPPVTDERASVSTTPMVNEQEQTHNTIPVQITNQELQQEIDADNAPSLVISTSATPTRSDNGETQGKDVVQQNTSILQINDNHELREQNSFNVTPIKSESGGAYSTPVKQIRCSRNLRSSNVTPTRPVNNNYRESQEQ